MQFCCTDMVVHKLEYKWTMKKFGLQLKLSKQHKHDITLKSASFSIQNWNEDIKWNFQLCIHGSVSHHKNFIGIAALLETTGEAIPENEFRSWQEYYFLNARNERILIYNTLESTSVCGWECNEFYRKEQLLNEADLFLVNDELTIVCQVNVMGESILVTGNYSAEANSTTNDHKLTNDIAELFITKKFADVTFALRDDVKIPAHKIILMSRSPVFARMIEDEERKKIEVDGNDEDFTIVINNEFQSTFTEILRYIYTDRVENLEEMEMSLFFASHEYQLDGLKAICVDSLCRTMCIEDAISTFGAAVRYRSETLKEFTRNFIFERLVDVVRSDEFQSMLINEPELVDTLLERDRREN